MAEGLFLREEVLEVYFHTAVHLGVETAGRGIVDTADAADGVLEGVDAVSFGVYAVKLAGVAEPVEHGGGAVVGEGRVAVKSDLLGVGAGEIVLAGGEAFDEDSGDGAVLDDVADVLDGGRVSVLCDVA